MTLDASQRANILELVKEKLGKPYEDLEFLLECFREVLMESGEEELANIIPWINSIDNAPNSFSAHHIQVYSIAFQLLNMVEVNGAVQNRRKRIDERGLAAVNGMWGQSLDHLQKANISPQTIASHLPEISVEPVLTAHPTEAKRTTVLEHHRDLYLLLVKRENQMWTRIEQKDIRREIKLVLDRLWRTGEIFVEKPDVASELRNIMHYLTNVFPDVVPMLDRSFEQAWEEAGFDKSLIQGFGKYPKIKFGDWVGGDRDGHPFVTDQVTEETLQTFRLHSFVIVRRSLMDLIRNLSFSCEIEHTPLPFQKRLYEIKEELGEIGEEALLRNKGEAFRQYVNLCAHKLPLEVKRQHAVEINEHKASYTYARQLLADLKLLQEALINFDAASSAFSDVHDTIRIVETFGFHLAHLDIRQNSSFHDRAISQLMDAAGLDGQRFLEWNEEKRMAFFNNELLTNRPFTHPKAQLSNEANAVVSCYTVVSKYIDRYGTDGLGSLIVSMTRSKSDLVAVYVLAREAGLTFTSEEDGGLVCKLPVVPLFETIEDLEASPDILTGFLSHPITKRSLEYHRKLNGYAKPVQQIMIGYSDSNKDGGIFASQWSLFAAQSKLADIGAAKGVKIRFFHGKGGTISRGAGPTHFFIRALPHGSINGDLRLTEQGETISQKYANKLNASFNLELLLAGTASASISHLYSEKKEHPLARTWEYLAKESRKKYQELMQNRHFIEFYGEATLIDAIESSRIGSRPARRTGSRTLADLRAIPWVFSWGQARYNMTSWYGVGSTLSKLKAEQPEEYQRFKDGVKTDPLIKYVITNIDTSLAATEQNIMKAYADLVQNEKVRQTIFEMLSTELQLTRQIIDDLFGAPFEQRRVNHFESNLLRETGLDVLHRVQIEQLKKWRKMKKEGNSPEETEQVLLTLLMTINAIASALRNTG